MNFEMSAVVDSDLLTRANALKDEGNAFLTQGKYALAAERYTQAIELVPTAIFFSNRAQALIKLESYGLAIADANEALRLDPKYIKAYYRRGSAHYALGKLKQALKDFKAVVAIVPNDQDALRKYKTCEKDIRTEAFQKAIENDQPVSELVVDADGIVVEESYAGPRLSFLSEAEPAVAAGSSFCSCSGPLEAPLLSVEFVRELTAYLREQKSLHRKYVLQVLLRAMEHFKRQSALLRLTLPRTNNTNNGNGNGNGNTDSDNKEKSAVCGTFTVCGDTHGQYYDLCNIFAINGEPSPSNAYLFNGDYVDRGSFSFETVFLLLCWKLALPNSLFLLRGNHETKNMNKIYGFHGEVKHKYDEKVMDVFSRLFQALPLAATIEGKVFVTHGGLSTQEGGVSLDEIAAINRFMEPPQSGLMSDLMWSDPQPQLGRSPSKRGLGFSFGPDYTRAFLQRNNLQLVIRSHEVRDEGYEVEHDGQCITVFSAPNYCDQMGNKGAMIRFTSEDMTPSFVKFEAVPHPNVPPMRYASNMFAL